MGAPRKSRGAGDRVPEGNDDVALKPWMLRFKTELDDDDEDIKVFMKQEDQDVRANDGANNIEANIEAAADGGNNNPIIIEEENPDRSNINGSNHEKGHGLRAQDAPPANKEAADEELERIVMAIDGRHCDKYKWFIERYIRQIHEPHEILSKQLYYRRVMGKHKTIQIRADPKGRERWVVKGMRPGACKRLDYEATRAHYTARNTARSLDWSAHKKRVPADRLGAILAEVTAAYDWPEIVTTENVDHILTIDDIRDISAYDGHRGLTIGAFPPPNRVSVESELGDIYNAEPAVIGSREPQVSQRGVLQPLSSLSSTLSPGNPHPSASLLARPERALYKRGYQNDGQEEHGEKRQRLNNEREGHPQDSQRQDEKGARLEALHQEFMKEMADISSAYHRRRLEIEMEFSSFI
ncbi:hypothetical protein F5Y00DRAFT_270490 [Daldinia vernicosa]|uniref:uncharacterized protein n=1 Tax=Daldinia vernicosa TaxID=114800 RepID=UPI002008ADE1|nr:uncharacterized protein F5Y00DRAFT_270490 [Daldinia vernicosa]KAI0848062.1 hypothetical protein F5Y00DRAFT_270490 [Daldinia vernicosa]